MRKSYSLLQSEISQDRLISDIRQGFDQIKDFRASNCSFTLSDILMSVFAMFSLKYESLLEFDNQSESSLSNLQTLFGIKSVGSDSCLRKVLDKLDWKALRSLLADRFLYLKKLGIVKQYYYLDGHTLVSVDGVEHFSSKRIHCDCCLSKTHKNGETTYHHSMLCAVMVHPQESEVFVMGTEPIQCQDGVQKNDCERNAKKRFMGWLSSNYKSDKLIFVEDALYANAPNVEQIRANHWDFIIAVKPDGNKHLFKLFEIRRKNNKLITDHLLKEGKVQYQFYFFNQVSINNANPKVKVNFLYCEQTDEKGKKTTFTWITSLTISTRNVLQIMKAGRARWKIENETFNTLKNQGYKFEHNYGHGHQNLSSVFAHLMLLAFLTDQTIQRCSKPFQKIWKGVGSKVKLWFMMKACFLIKNYNNFKELYWDIAAQFNVKLE
jgi:hypothetical protein